MVIFERKIGYHMVQKIGNNNKSDQGWEVSGKYYIITDKEKWISLIDNNNKTSI